MCYFVVITSRNDHDYPYAKLFIKHKFGHLIKYIHNTRNEPKSKFVQKIRPRIHLDDDLKKLLELSSEPITLCYYRQAENTHQNLPFGNSRIKEIRFWEEFYLECHKLKQLHEAVCWKYGLENDYRHNTQIVRLLQHMHKHEKNVLLEEYVHFRKHKAA